MYPFILFLYPLPFIEALFIVYTILATYTEEVRHACMHAQTTTSSVYCGQDIIT